MKNKLIEGLLVLLAAVAVCSFATLIISVLMTLGCFIGALWQIPSHPPEFLFKVSATGVLASLIILIPTALIGCCVEFFSRDA